MPRVSIILPVYNGEQFIKQAINSVLVQSFSDWELIVVDDGSSDRGTEIISWYMGQDKRIRLISHQTNLGLVASLTEAVASSAGELIARLDCDDYWSEPRKLEKQIQFLDANPSFALVGTWATFIDNTGKRLRDFKPPAEDSDIRGQMLMRNCFLHSSIVVRKLAVVKAGGYRSAERHVEDYGLWLRIGESSKFANLPECLVTYRSLPGSVTKSNNREQITRALGLISEHKQFYPNYFFGRLKWRIQSLLS